METVATVEFATHVINLWIKTEMHNVEGIPVVFVIGQCDNCRNIYSGYSKVLDDIADEWLKEHRNGICPPKNRKAKSII